MGDVLRTTIVLGLAVLGIFFVGKIFFTAEPENPTSDVDYLLAASGVEAMANFDPLVPPELAEGWRATVAEFNGRSWRLVVVTDEQKFVSYEHARVSVREMLMTSTVEQVRGESTEFAGHTWNVGKDENGNPAYFREDGDFVHMVISSADTDVVQGYVASFVPFSSLD